MKTIRERADLIFAEHQHRIFIETDKRFILLLCLEWIAGILTALVVSPLAWEGARSSLHIHVLLAVFGGAGLVALPAALTIWWPGQTITRHVIAISQVLFSVLFIHLSNGRIEAHFHIFGSLAFLAFYRDKKVLISASTVVLLDHIIRGFWFPYSVFGVGVVSYFRPFEHAFWVGFEDVFLFVGIDHSIREMHYVANQTAELEHTSENIELVVKEKTKQLAQSERESKRLANIVQQSNDAILSIGLDGKIQSWNRGAERLYQYTPEEVIGQVYNPPLPPEVKADHLKLLKKVRRGQSVESMETLTYRKDGFLVDVEMTLSPLRDENDRIEAFSVIARDISQKKLAEKRVTEFYSTVSHELRTPLTSIRGALALIGDGIVDRSSDEAVELIDIAQKSTMRLIRLINDILDLRKIEAGKFELNLEETTARTLIESSVLTMMGFAEERHVSLISNIPEHPIYVQADQDRITQVLSNLISNAVKYAPIGSTVLVSAECREDFVRFNVTDRGAGIPPEHQSKLFNKFQQVDSSDTRAKEGTGLGLAISKSIVEEHGGTIGFTSVPHVNTVFWFELAQMTPSPVVSPAPVADLSVIKQPISQTQLDERGRKTLLIVEDDLELSTLLKISFEQQQYHCVQAQTLEQAKKFLRDDAPSAVLLDLGLPDGNGLDLLGKLDQCGDLTEPPLPVIIITGSDKSMALDGKPAVVDWLHKPFDQSALSEAVRRALNISPKRRKAIVFDDNPRTKHAVISGLQDLDVELIDFYDSNDSNLLTAEYRQQIDLVVFKEGSGIASPSEPINPGDRYVWARNTPMIGYETEETDADSNSVFIKISRHSSTAAGEELFMKTVESAIFTKLSQLSTAVRA